MLEMIEDRKGSVVLERRDLLSNLIRASMETSDSRKDFVFTHRNLLGNIFAFLFAGKPFASRTPDFPLNCCRGYDTTSSALSYAIGLLAVHQEEQEELYKHVRSVVPHGRLPVRRSNCHSICSLYPIRPIKMFPDSRGFSRSSTKHSAFFLQ